MKKRLTSLLLAGLLLVCGPILSPKVSEEKIEEVGGQKGNLTIEYSVTFNGEEIKLSGNLSDGSACKPPPPANSCAAVRFSPESRRHRTGFPG